MKQLTNLIAYVIHYKALTERKEFLLKQFDKHSLDYYFIENYDRNTLTEEDKKLFKVKFPSFHKAITLSHIDAYQRTLKSDYKYNLILEDDVVFDEDFSDKLAEGLEQLPEDYDMLFIGTCFNFHIPQKRIKPSQFIYEKCREPTGWGGNGATRCTDSYLVSKKGSQKVIDYISQLEDHQIDKPVDWWLNQVIRDLELKIYWMEPTIVRQGSEKGDYDKSH